MAEQGEVQDQDKVWHEVTLHYRTYYHEPQYCPTELWALSIGVKHRLDPASTDRQNKNIRDACMRAAQAAPDGSDLLAFNLGYG